MRDMISPSSTAFAEPHQPRRERALPGTLFYPAAALYGAIVLPWSVLALTGALGAVIGGLAFGVLMDDFGFRGLALVVTGIMALWLASGLLLRDRIVSKKPKREPKNVGGRGLGTVFLLFLAANLISSVILLEGRLGTSLLMRSQSFSSAAISSTAAVGGGVGLLLSPLLGSLSDHLGRKRPLIACYFVAAAGVLTLAQARNIWGFWVAASLLSIFSYAGGGLGSAVVADLVESDALGRGMSFYSATVWIGGVIGFAAIGVSLQSLGVVVSFVLGAGILVLASLLLLPIKGRSEAD